MEDTLAKNVFTQYRKDSSNINDIQYCDGNHHWCYKCFKVMSFPKKSKWWGVLLHVCISDYAYHIPCGYVKLFSIPYTDLLKKRSKWIYIYRVNERCLYRCYLVTQVMHLRYFAMDSFNKKALQQGILQFWNGIVISLYNCHREILSFIFHSLHEIALCCRIIWVTLWI